MNNIEEQIKDTELFMLAQFVDVLEVLERFDKIEEIKKDIQDRKKMYLNVLEKNEVNIDFLTLSLDTVFIKDKVNKAKEIFTDKQLDEVSLAYKIGLIDGLKVKEK